MAKSEGTHDPELMKWAIEQSVKLHSQHGLSSDGILREAKALYDMVKNGPLPSSQ